MKFSAVVTIEFEVEDELVNCPVNGPVAIAERYAGMATKYASVGATGSKVVSVFPMTCQQSED